MKIEDLKPIELENEIDYKYNSEIKCPYCNYEFENDAYEIVDVQEEDNQLIMCGSCERSFYCSPSISISYSTEPFENVLIEDYQRAVRLINSCVDANNDWLKRHQEECLSSIRELFEEYKDEF